MTDHRWRHAAMTANSPAHVIAVRLRTELDGIFDAETIARYLHSSDERLAPTRKLTARLPLMTERSARDGLIGTAGAFDAAFDELDERITQRATQLTAF